MGNYDVGQKYTGIPVLKFMGYDKVVVLLNGRPEEAVIEGGTNNFCGGEIYHITAPSGTIADVEIVSGSNASLDKARADLEFMKQTMGYDYTEESVKDYAKERHKGPVRKRLLARNIRVK